MTNATTSRSLSDLIDEVARATNQPAKTVKPIIQATLQAISAGVTGGNKYQLSGFGTFETRQRSERTGINPQSKSKMTIPASRTVGFTPSSAWKQQLNSNTGQQTQSDNVLTRERG
ncbi:MAG: HU family DNA-binding protein [Chloroflexota bacterium]|nr:HU family DNA-binding protein [Chloroflexota bacterium]